MGCSGTTEVIEWQQQLMYDEVYVENNFHESVLRFRCSITKLVLVKCESLNFSENRMKGIKWYWQRSSPIGYLQ